MIEELLKAGKISRFDYLCFMVFTCNEYGRELYDKALMDTLMEEPASGNDLGIQFAFIAGKRAFFKDIKSALDFVNQQMKEVNNDKPEPKPEPEHPAYWRRR